MKTLFLDFDGVLHPSISTDFFSKIDILEQTIKNNAVAIVISSSWRFQYTLEELKNMLGPCIAAQVIGVTGDVHIGKFARYEEIMKWIHIHQECTDYSILDDSAYEFPKNLPNLILCDSRTGLDRQTSQRLVAWLQA